VSNGTTEDWNDDKIKNEAVYKVLRYLAKNPKEGSSRVGKDDEARKLFEDQGGIQVPVDSGARVIFFATGEQDLLVGASVILDVPPDGYADKSDEELKKFVLGNYTYWAPHK